MQDANKLKVYQESKNLAKEIYQIDFPQSEKFNLQSQIQRAANSIALNIGEGCGRASQAEFKQFLVQARGSCKEVQTALELCREHGILNFQAFTALNDKADHVGRMLTSLIQKVGGKNGTE